jgi:hypothetical protein
MSGPRAAGLILPIHEGILYRENFTYKDIHLGDDLLKIYHSTHIRENRKSLIIRWRYVHFLRKSKASPVLDNNQ